MSTEFNNDQLGFLSILFHFAKKSEDINLILMTKKPQLMSQEDWEDILNKLSIPDGLEKLVDSLAKQFKEKFAPK